MKNILFVIIVMIVCSCNNGTKPTEFESKSYILVKQIGEEYDSYFQLVISTESVSKYSILKNDDFNDIYDSSSLSMDTVWVRNRIVGDQLYNQIREYIMSNTGDRFQGEIDYSESPIVGYSISIYGKDEMIQNDYCSNNEKCNLYFKELIRFLEKHHGDSIIKDINNYYMPKLSHPGWGNPQPGSSI